MRIAHTKRNKQTSRIKGHTGNEKARHWSQKAHGLKKRGGRKSSRA